MEIILQEAGQRINHQLYEAENSRVLLVLAHGAGAGMTHSFMIELAKNLKAKHISVLLFNFPYMEEGRKSPGSPKKNIAAWAAVLDEAIKSFNDHDIFIGGKSYGGRMASHLLAENPQGKVKGIIYFGFPLHAPGKEGIERAAHLSQVRTPQLFLQGAKDKLARIDLIDTVVHSLSEGSIHIFKDADHSFHVPKKSGTTDEEVLKELAIQAANWMHEKLSN